VFVKNCTQRSGLAAGLAFITVSPEQKLLIYFEDEGNNKKLIEKCLPKPKLKMD
jgi:hypothetical protein